MGYNNTQSFRIKDIAKSACLNERNQLILMGRSHEEGKKVSSKKKVTMIMEKMSQRSLMRKKQLDVHLNYPQKSLEVVIIFGIA